MKAKDILNIVLILISILVLFILPKLSIFLGLKDSIIFKILLASLTAIVGFFVSRFIGNKIEELEIEKSKQIGNSIKFAGYFITFFLVLSWFTELSLATLLTTSAFGGIIIGLALQPVLGNLFAGMIIMISKYVEVGSKVRILSTQIPYSLLGFPAYKYLSVESADTGYKGEIISLEWFFTILKTDEGKIIKIPNLVLLNSAVIDYSKSEEEFVYSLRVEFPLKMKKGWNLEKLEKEINKILKDYNVVEGPYFNEQSDKDYVFVRMKIKSKNKNWEKGKSEVLKKLLLLKEKVEKA